ncbi:MAG TPA: carboxypeptidase regulatory-like domain-containing protein, partial [Longimicrobiales bacterium]|nr:carboxypeptidase regulatory-like domain-containing protein [Longimicrobiales bacterium]
MPRPLRSLLPLLVAALAVGSLSESLSAQSRTTSSVRGQVLGPGGAPVVQATVTIRHEGTGFQRVTGTNQEGDFLFLLLQPGGPYTLTVQNLGTRDYRQEGIQLQVGETAIVQVTLETQAIEIEGIEVRAERTEIFDPGQVGPATLLNEEVVESVPILSRNIMELAVLSPLVKTTEGGGFSVAGQNDRYNSLLIDGVLNKDVFGLTAGGVPGGQAGGKLIPIDAISQYEILVAPFDVRLSGFIGGVMNAVTRSGTNEWFGRVVGVARDEVLIGDLVLPTGPVEASGVDRRLIGASVGGPIIPNRAHFFLSTEFERRRQPPAGYNLFRDDPTLVRISPEAVEDVADSFQNQFGFDVGEAGPYPLEQELANLFGRLDWSFGDGSRLTLRNIFAWARNDESPNRAAFERYELSSNAVYREALSNTTSLQYFRNFGQRVGNELNVSLHHSSDGSEAASDFPQVEVEVLSSIDGASYGRALRVGSQFFAQDNDLSQTNFRVTDLVTIANGENDITLGLTGAFYDFQHRFLPGSLGEYFYASQTDLDLNAPQRFQRTILAPGEEPGIGFNVFEAGLLAQSQLDAGKGLTMRFGIRVDVPWVLDSPAENPDILAEYGFSTADLPSGQFLISPRWGFNWQSEGERRTQVRGGAGMFAGQIPFVWLSNAFHNDGLRSATYLCNGRVTDDPLSGNTVPPLDPAGLPGTCAAGD